MQRATVNKVLTSISQSPTHLLVREEAEMLAKVALMLLAMALPIMVLPVPGGPNSKKPLAGAVKPYKQQAVRLSVSCILHCSHSGASSKREHCKHIPNALQAHSCTSKVLVKHMLNM